jgi:hypothetical protein
MYYEDQVRKSLWQGVVASVGLLILTAILYTLPVRPDAPDWVVQYWQLKLPTLVVIGLFGLFFFPWQIRRHKRQLNSS